MSIRSIHNDDISGEGTSIDFSLIDWPQQVLQGKLKCSRSNNFFSLGVFFENPFSEDLLGKG